MSKLLDIFRGGAASHTEAMRQSTSLTMAYLLEQNRKFELFMREKVELLEGRVAAQATRDEFEPVDDDQIDAADLDGAAAEMVVETTPVVTAAPADLLEEEDEPFQPWAGAAGSAPAAQETAFGGLAGQEPEEASAEAPAPDPQHDEAVDWQFLLGDRAESPPFKQAESGALAGAGPFNDGPAVDDAEPGLTPVETGVLEEAAGQAVESEPEDRDPEREEIIEEILAEPGQGWIETEEAEPQAGDPEREEIIEENLAGPEQDNEAEGDELEPAQMIQAAPAQGWSETVAGAGRAAEEIAVDSLAGSAQDEAWDGASVAEDAPVAEVDAIETTAPDQAKAETAPSLAPAEETAPDAADPPELTGSAQTRLAGALSRKGAANLEPDAGSMLPAWLTQF